MVKSVMKYGGFVDYIIGVAWLTFTGILIMDKIYSLEECYYIYASAFFPSVDSSANNESHNISRTNTFM